MSTHNSDCNDRPKGNGIRIACAALTGLIAGTSRAVVTWLLSHLNP
ncbi:hypothetical protein AB0B27_14240 [Micromonospora rifamycinica]